jgi:solute carrier family 6 (neurotransmitter transporter, GABA) member 1
VDGVLFGMYARDQYRTCHLLTADCQGNQLRRDLNITVAPDGSGNWRLPIYWPIVLRYVSAPVLCIVFSFGYPVFIAVRNDPLHIFGFTCAHLVVVTVIFAYIVPRSLDVLVPAKRHEEGVRQYAPQVLCGLDDIRVSQGIEAGTHASGSGQDSNSDAEKKDGAATAEYGYGWGFAAATETGEANTAMR